MLLPCTVNDEPRLLHVQGIYFIAVSGVLYDIIRGVPFIGADNKGNPMFINPSSGTQFGVEGLIVGGLSALLSSASRCLHPITSHSCHPCFSLIRVMGSLHSTRAVSSVHVLMHRRLHRGPPSSPSTLLRMAVG